MCVICQFQISLVHMWPKTDGHKSRLYEVIPLTCQFGFRDLEIKSRSPSSELDLQISGVHMQLKVPKSKRYEVIAFTIVCSAHPPTAGDHYTVLHRLRGKNDAAIFQFTLKNLRSNYTHLVFHALHLYKYFIHFDRNFGEMNYNTVDLDLLCSWIFHDKLYIFHDFCLSTSAGRIVMFFIEVWCKYQGIICLV